MRKTTFFICCLLLGAAQVGCGLMDLDEQEELPVAGMHLQSDTLYLMVGDQFALTPVFSPDTVTVQDVFFTTSADSVLSVNDGVFTGMAEGWAQVRAISVERQLEDSCMVRVMRRWEANLRDFPHEMMVYADVSVHGQPFNPATMVLGAFVDDELRGAAELMEWRGSQYVRIRVGSDISYYDPEGVTEEVVFRLYHRQQLSMEEFPQTLEFDGEAHGTLSNLFELKN